MPRLGRFEAGNVGLRPHSSRKTRWCSACNFFLSVHSWSMKMPLKNALGFVEGLLILLNYPPCEHCSKPWKSGRMYDVYCQYIIHPPFLSSGLTRVYQTPSSNFYFSDVWDINKSFKTLLWREGIEKEGSVENVLCVCFVAVAKNQCRKILWLMINSQ